MSLSTDGEDTEPLSQPEEEGEKIGFPAFFDQDVPLVEDAKPMALLPSPPVPV